MKIRKTHLIALGAALVFGSGLLLTVCESIE